MEREKRETAFAEQYLKLKGSDLKSKDAFKIIQKMGFPKTRSTMNRHIASLRRTGHALSLVRKDSSHPSLNDDQMSVVNSWILGQNTNNRPIGYCDVQKFIKDTFSVEVCRRTAGRILHRLGHTQKTCQSKTGGFKKPNADYPMFLQTDAEEVKNPEDMTFEELFEDDDLSEKLGLYNVSPESIRKKITMFLATKEMTQTQFLNDIGVNSTSLGRFMKLKGRENGRQNGTYGAAVRFFYWRDLQAKKAKKVAKEADKDRNKELKKQESFAAKTKKKESSQKSSSTLLPAESPTSAQPTNSGGLFPFLSLDESVGKTSKKRKASDGPGIDSGTELSTSSSSSSTISPLVKKTKSALSSSQPHTTPPFLKRSPTETDVFLTQVNSVTLPDSVNAVYDDCDVIRTKIASFLQTEQVSMTKFASALNITITPINRFLARKGWNEGCSTDVYYKAYFFFEKLRLLRGESKSHRRTKAEQDHPSGHSLELPRKYTFI
jgi:transposase